MFGQEGRTTYVTLVALVMFFIFTQLKGGRKWLAMGVLVLGAASVFMLSTKVQTRFNQVLIESQAAQHATTTEENFTSSGLRIGFWRGSVDIFKQHPILGAGVGTWARRIPQIRCRTPDTPEIAVSGGNPHQEYLLMASQLGVVGLALFLLWIGHCVLASDGSLANQSGWPRKRCWSRLWWDVGLTHTCLTVRRGIFFVWVWVFCLLATGRSIETSRQTAGN